MPRLPGPQLDNDLGKISLLEILHSRYVPTQSPYLGCSSTAGLTFQRKVGRRVRVHHIWELHCYASGRNVIAPDQGTPRTNGANSTPRTE